jgi:hypothetical protein
MVHVSLNFNELDTTSIAKLVAHRSNVHESARRLTQHLNG